ncbi:MAG TPA: DUF1810 domain-containing protein [Ramlibacter sp.]|jgi:uncharacterized protein (DUF1810 family)|uniref:DUF1810 domain-containing protein n=1 Tax=Ramlibacter sp. TaxID=1917967 RepID=UPI002D3F5B48|nr:DUF1810 domain-containing protein [Ramlibacter sp.]HZY17920.1 DUF1810 domain-containing protein [Ramlibacter sp.]
MAAPADAFDLRRFTRAQAGVIGQVRDELRAGHKRTHWMWFVFPQLRGLGTSATARTYGIASLEEARAYLRHRVLGPRLRECCELLLAHPPGSGPAILGSPDDLKLRSCLTLFQLAAPDEPLFPRCLAHVLRQGPDPRTLQLCAGVSGGAGSAPAGS